MTVDQWLQPQANIDDDEFAVLKLRAAGLLNAAEEALEAIIAEDELTEVDCGAST